MNLLADESVDYNIINSLRKAGYSIVSVLEDCPGSPDEFVLEKATKTRSILLTEDKDFGELVYRLKKASHGIILLRLAGTPSIIKIEIVISCLNKHSQQLNEAFTVITNKSIRIRQLRIV